MDPGLKQRLIGACVLVALAAIFLPMLVQGPAPDSGVSDVPLQMPDAPQDQYETRDLPLVAPGAAPDGGALGMDTRAASMDRSADSDRLPTVDTASAAPSVNEAPPLGDSHSADADTTSAPTPSVAAVPTAAPKPDTTTSAEAPKPSVASVATPATSRVGFAVQLAAFSKMSDADALLDRVHAAGFSAFTEQVNTDKGVLTRVRVGPVSSRADADQLKVQVKAKLGLDGLVRPHP